MKVDPNTALTLYLSGLSGGEVAERLGCSHGTIYKITKAAGVTRPASSLDHEEVISLFRELGTAAMAAEALGISGTHVGRVLKLHGIINEYKPRTEANERYFQKIDTEEKAYWLGFIVADGCLMETKYGYRLQVGLQRGDAGHLKKLNQALGKTKTDPVLGHSSLHGKKYPTATLSVRSRLLGEDLMALGVRPRKSMRERVELSKVPKSFHKDLWRGFVDGDGHVSAAGKGMGARIVVWGSPWLLGEFREYCLSVTSTKARVRPLKAPHVGLYRFELAGDRSVSVIESLYREASVSLDRKALVAEEVCERRNPMNGAHHESERSQARRQLPPAGHDSVV